MKKKSCIPYLILPLAFSISSCGGNTSSGEEATSEEMTSSVESESLSEESSSVEESSSLNPDDYFYDVYSNPLVVASNGTLYNGECADPTLARDPDTGTLYIIVTGGLMLKSENGCEWETVGYVIDRPTWGDEIAGATCGLWAPELKKIGDQWIMYYSLSAWGAPAGIGYATADSVEGPYTDQGKLVSCDDIGIENCIDPFVFVDDDGRVYMGAGSFYGLALWELTSDGTACLNGIEYASDNKVWIGGQPGTSWDGSKYEGGLIFKKDGYYYFMGSAGSCCEGSSSTYRVYVGKSTSITGPYRDASKMSMAASGNSSTYGQLVVWAGNATDKSVYGPGHNTIFVDDAGQYWMYYHGYTESDNFSVRHLLLDKLEWDANGYPYVNGYKPSYGEDLDGPWFYDAQ